MNLNAPKTRTTGLSDGENRVILTEFVKPQYRRVTDGQRQTGGRTDYDYRALLSIS